MGRKCSYEKSGLFRVSSGFRLAIYRTCLQKCVMPYSFRGVLIIKVSIVDFYSRISNIYYYRLQEICIYCSLLCNTQRSDDGGEEGGAAGLGISLSALLLAVMATFFS